MPDYEVVNLAVDQMSTFDLEERKPEDNPWQVYGRERKKQFNTPETEGDIYYPVSEVDGSIYSFENLKKINASKNVRVIVLSIGGNDIYLRREIQEKMFRSLLPGKGHLLDEVAQEFGQRYQAILSKIKEIVSTNEKNNETETLIIPIIPYHPHHKFSLLFGAPSSSFQGKLKVFSWLAEKMQYVCLSKLVSPLVKQILQTCLSTSSTDTSNPVQVIDLSKTFDPNDETDYGTGKVSRHNTHAGWSGAEPSNKSSMYIARLISAITKQQFSNDHQGQFKKDVHQVWLDKKNDSVKAKKIDSTFISNYSFASLL
jgi:hypothetical protein